MNVNVNHVSWLCLFMHSCFFPFAHYSYCIYYFLLIHFSFHVFYSVWGQYSLRDPRMHQFLHLLKHILSRRIHKTCVIQNLDQKRLSLLQNPSFQHWGRLELLHSFLHLQRQMLASCSAYFYSSEDLSFPLFFCFTFLVKQGILFTKATQ